MSDLAKGAAGVADKLLGFLDLFDLSFFVSGAVAYAALSHTAPFEAHFGLSATFAGVVRLVVGAYVLGLFCHAIGAAVRKAVVESFRAPDTGRQFAAMMAEHDLTRHYPTYFPERPRSFYPVAWAIARGREELIVSFALLQRYWVLTATYDGLTAALQLWVVALLRPSASIAFGATSTWIGVVLVEGIALVTLLRAHRFKRTQIEELAATLAYWHGDARVPPPAVVQAIRARRARTPSS